MMETETTNTHRPVNRTLTVIDGGLNSKAGVQSPPTAPKPKLLEQVRNAIRARHYSYMTEKAYVGWIKRFIFFHDKRHPAEMGEPEVAKFLSSLATNSKVSASTQNQALHAILFLYQEILQRKIGFIEGVVRAQRPRRLPVVLTREEVRRILGGMNGTPWLMAMLLYGAGLRLMECCRLRVKDIDFSQNQIVIRGGKGNKDRHTMLPTAVKEILYRHLQDVKKLHDGDLKQGLGRVVLPNALERKYPNGPQEWGWQWVFPRQVTTPTGSTARSVDTIFTNRCSRGRSRKQDSRRAYLNLRAVTPCVIHLQRICSKTDMTSEQCRSYLDTMTSAPQ
jgi:integron integrase